MPKPKGSQAPKVPPVPAASVTLKLTLDSADARALRLLAVHRGCSVSQVVTDLLAASPTRLVLSERPRGSSGSAVPGPSSPQGDSAPFGLVSEEVA